MGYSLNSLDSLFLTEKKKKKNLENEECRKGREGVYCITLTTLSLSMMMVKDMSKELRSRRTPKQARR